MAHPRTTEGQYAKDHGINLRRLQRLGGSARLEAMAPDARVILLKSNVYGFSRELKMGLTERGMRRATDARTKTA